MPTALSSLATVQALNMASGVGPRPRVLKNSKLGLSVDKLLTFNFSSTSG